MTFPSHSWPRLLFATDNERTQMSPEFELVLVGGDETLQHELHAVLESLDHEHLRLKRVADERELLESARFRTPDLILAEFGKDPSNIAQLAQSLKQAGVPTPFVAFLRPNGFDDDVSESSVLIQALRAGVLDFLHRPISLAEVRSLLERVHKDRRGKSSGVSAPTGRVFSFVSNKGGVGKSTLSVNSAVALARKYPDRVLLVDASLQMGVAAPLLDLQPESTLYDIALEADRLDETMIRQMAVRHHSGLHLLAAPADAVEGTAVDDTLIARVIAMAKRSYDYVVVDTFPMFDRVVIAVLDLSDRVYIVMENVVPTLLGGVKLLEVLERIGLPEEDQRIIVNRFQRVSGSLPLADIAEQLNRELDYVLPYDKRVLSAANLGEPVALQLNRLGGFAKGLKQVVADMLAMESSSQSVGQVTVRAELGQESQAGEQPAPRGAGMVSVAERETQS